MLAERAHGIWIFLLSIFVIYVINLYKVQFVLFSYCDIQLNDLFIWNSSGGKQNTLTTGLPAVDRRGNLHRLVVAVVAGYYVTKLLNVVVVVGLVGPVWRRRTLTDYR